MRHHSIRGITRPFVCIIYTISHLEIYSVIKKAPVLNSYTILTVSSPVDTTCQLLLHVDSQIKTVRSQTSFSNQTHLYAYNARKSYNWPPPHSSIAILKWLYRSLFVIFYYRTYDIGEMYFSLSDTYIISNQKHDSSHQPIFDHVFYTEQ